MRPTSGWAVVSTAAMLAAVCSGCNSNSLGTVEAGGTVTYRGEPLAGATVTLIPQAGQRAAAGISDASGQFRVTTLLAGDGAMPGSYKVTVTKTQESAVPKTTQEMSLDEMRKIEQQMIGKAPPPGVEPVNLLPIKYKSDTTTPLSCEVSASGNNNFQFDLTD